MHTAQKTFLGMILALTVLFALGAIDSEEGIGWVVAGLLVLFLISYATGASIFSVMWSFLSGVGRGGVATVQWVLSQKKPSARFMGWFEKWRFFDTGTQGFLVDGKSVRLSEKVSMQSVLAVGGMGSGKSSIFVMPNIYTLDDCSLVISDTSGEIYAQTSGYLAQKGFDIKVLNLMDTSVGETYNPLENANGYTDIAQVAHLIVRSSLDSDDGQFWSAGAEKIIRIMIQCLRNRGEPEHLNLANVLHLLNSFDAHLKDGGRLDQFVVESTLEDLSTYSDYRGFLAGNERTVLSFLSTATVGLDAVGNPDIARLTQTSSFDLGNLQRRKTAFFLKARQQDLRFYSFILNLFYTELFNTLLSSLDPNNLPVYLLLDEFGHLTIPDFDIYATTARKNRVAIWAFLQSRAQLESRYGDKGAETIQDGFGTQIYLPGVGLDTAKALERRLGKVQKPIEQGDQTIYREENLLNESEIIQMRGDEALLIHTNKRPVKLRTKPFYEQSDMVQKSKMEPYPLHKRKEVGLQYAKL